MGPTSSFLVGDLCSFFGEFVVGDTETHVTVFQWMFLSTSSVSSGLFPYTSCNAD